MNRTEANYIGIYISDPDPHLCPGSILRQNSLAKPNVIATTDNKVTLFSIKIDSLKMAQGL